MRKILVAASILCVIAVALTTAAAQQTRTKSQANPPRSAYVSKDVPINGRTVATQMATVQQERMSYRGLSVRPDPEATGDMLALHQQITALMTRLDYVPAHRVDHFRWIPDEMKLPILGWSGHIVETTPIPGGFRVTVKIWPVAGFGTQDYTLESYSYMNGRLNHLGSTAAPTRGVTIFH